MIEISKKRFIVIVVATFVIGGIFTFGFSNVTAYMGFGYVSVSSEDYYEMKESYEKYYKLDILMDAISEQYYEEVDEEALIESLYKDLFEELDDVYSMYLNEEEYAAKIDSYYGEFYGIGIVATATDDNKPLILSVYEDSPAEEVGIQIGDIVEKVDGEVIDDFTEAMTLIRGDEGTTVTLEILRGDETIEVTVERAKIDTKDVASEILDDNIGYIQIGSFSPDTPEEFKEALETMEEEEVDGIVIDLRSNGGGSVEAAIEIADMLMDEGVVINASSEGGEETVYTTEDGKTDLPMVILANSSTASSSEILIAGLHDQGIPLVGETTYGKGVTQSIVGLTDGSGYAITNSKFFTPSGDEINEVGIEPDYYIEDIEEQLKKAISLLLE